jgi:hypothetical protein
MLLSSPGLCPFPGIRLSFGGLSRGSRLQIHGCFALLLPRLGSLSLSFLLLLNSTGTSIDLSRRRSCGSETKEPCKQSFKPRDSAGHMKAAKQSSMHESVDNHLWWWSRDYRQLEHQSFNARERVQSTWIL